MTELPRRAYPMVVPPPGGFEDAVRRGRRRRRKQTGGSSALALVLAGAVAYSVIGHDGGTSRLRPTNPTVDHSRQPDGTSPTPTPSASTADPGNPGQSPSAPGSGNTHNVPPVAPSPGVSVGPSGTPGPKVQPQAYAKRDPLTHSSASTASELNCLPDQNSNWCTTARVTASGTGTYLLEYAICRSAVMGGANLAFDRTVEVDFAAQYVNDSDTVWTWSKGQPNLAKKHSVPFNGGDCVVWSTTWDGYDDYGRDPQPGSYLFIATAYATTAIPQAQANFTHD